MQNPTASTSGSVQPSMLVQSSMAATSSASTSATSKSKGKKRARDGDDNEEMHLAYIPNSDASVHEFSKSSPLSR